MKSGRVARMLSVFLLLGACRHTPAITAPDGTPLSDSVAEMYALEINGTTQHLVVRGKDSSAPIMLFLHGGPGMPELPLLRKYQEPLESHFILVHWEQREAGRSYSGRNDPSLMRVGTFVDDAEAVVRHLCGRFERDKVYLLAHSWGTAIGIRLAQRRPDLIQAYVGVGQMTDMPENERLSYQWALGEARRRGESRAVKELLAIGSPPYSGPESWRAMLTERKWVREFGGGVHGATGFGQYIPLFLRASEWTLWDLIRVLRGEAFALRTLWDEISQFNILTEEPRLEVPVYIAGGKHDFMILTTLAETYVRRLRAPHKQFLLFEKSAHNPNFEEPERFNAWIIETVLGRNADRTFELRSGSTSGYGRYVHPSQGAPATGHDRRKQP